MAKVLVDEKGYTDGVLSSSLRIEVVVDDHSINQGIAALAQVWMAEAGGSSGHYEDPGETVPGEDQDASGREEPENGNTDEKPKEGEEQNLVLELSPEAAACLRVLIGELFSQLL